MRRLISIAFLLSWFLVRPAEPGVATIVATRDNTLFEDANGDTSNGAGPGIFAGRNSQERTRRAVLEFDLTGVIPAEVRVDSAALTLHVSSAPDEIARRFELHRITRDWGEGTSTSSGGAGTAATAGDATWLCAFHPDVAWNEPGGDFADVASADQVCGDVGFCTWNAPQLLADVQAWLADPTRNHGWILLGEEIGVRTVRRFDARESDVPDQRPRLTIYFSNSEPVVTSPRTWGQLKASYR
jgi:hypothetical protein